MGRAESGRQDTLVPTSRELVLVRCDTDKVQYGLYVRLPHCVS